LGRERMIRLADWEGRDKVSDPKGGETRGGAGG